MRNMLRSWHRGWIAGVIAVAVILGVAPNLTAQDDLRTQLDIFGQVNGSTTVYRFWPGKIHYAQSIRISTEHGHENDTPANYSSVVYYYFLPE